MRDRNLERSSLSIYVKYRVYNSHIQKCNYKSQTLDIYSDQSYMKIYKYNLNAIHYKCINQNKSNVVWLNKRKLTLYVFVCAFIYRQRKRKWKKGDERWKRHVVCLFDIICSLFKLAKQHLSSRMKQSNPSERLFSEQICSFCVSEVLLWGLCSLSASKLSFFPVGPQLSCSVSITTDC